VTLQLTCLTVCVTAILIEEDMNWTAPLGSISTSSWSFKILAPPPTGLLTRVKYSAKIDLTSEWGSTWKKKDSRRLSCYANCICFLWRLIGQIEYDLFQSFRWRGRRSNYDFCMWLIIQINKSRLTQTCCAF